MEQNSLNKFRNVIYINYFRLFFINENKCKNKENTNAPNPKSNINCNEAYTSFAELIKIINEPSRAPIKKYIRKCTMILRFMIILSIYNETGVTKNK